MARTPMVTRTMKTSIVELLCVDLNTQQSVTLKVRLPRSYKSDKEILKVAPAYVAENIKVVHVLGVEVEPKLYGITEEDFMKYAVELNPRNVGAETEDSEVESDAE